MATRIRLHFDSAEKRFLFVCVLLTGAFLGTLLWWGTLNELPEIEMPAQTPLAVNAFDDFFSAAMLAVAAPRNPPLDAMFDRKNVPRKDWPRVYPLWRKKAWLSQNTQALKALREGLPKPYQFPADPKTMFNFMLWRGYGNLSNALRVESDVRAAQGDWKGAAQSALEGLQFGIKTQNGESSTRQLKVLQTHFDANFCRSAARRIFQWHTQRRPLWQQIQHQKYFYQLMLLDVLRQRDWADQIFRQLGAPASYSDLLPVQFKGKKRLFNELTRYFDARIAAAKKPYATAPSVARPAGVLGMWMERRSMDDANARFNNAATETRTALLIVALALRAYHLESGAYPATLSQLTPNTLPQIPSDPFGGGEGLRYKKQGNNFVLWSIGPDKKDDGGVPVGSNAGPGLTRQDVFGDEAENEVEMPYKGDWVHGKNR